MVQILFFVSFFGDSEMSQQLEVIEPGYRTMIVSSVKPIEDPKDSFLISFTDSMITLMLHRGYLEKKKIADVKKGDLLLIKGKDGNRDCNFEGIGQLEDIIGL